MILSANKKKLRRSPIIWFGPLMVLAFTQIVGCGVTNPDENNQVSELPSTLMEEVAVPDNFDFSIRICHSLEVDLQTHDGSPYPGVRVDVRLPDGNHLATGFTGDNGTALLNFVLPSSTREVVVSAPAIGIVIAEQQVFLSDGLHTLSIR